MHQSAPAPRHARVSRSSTRRGWQGWKHRSHYSEERDGLQADDESELLRLQLLKSATAPGRERASSIYDPKAEVGWVPVVLTKEESEDWKAPQSRHILVAREGEATRARGAILQASLKGELMATEKQRAAARRNIKKAAAAARQKRTIAHLPKSTRTALGKQAAKVARQKRRRAA